MVENIQFLELENINSKDIVLLNSYVTLRKYFYF